MQTTRKARKHDGATGLDHRPRQPESTTGKRLRRDDPRHRRGHTDLVGEIADQTQMHGLLSRIRDLGLELEKVTVLPEPEQPPPPRVVLLPVFGALVAVGVPLLLALSGVIATTGVDPYRFHRPAVHPGPVRADPFVVIAAHNR